MPTPDPSSEDAFHDLYAAHHPWLVGWLRGRLGNIDHAADLAQDTFIRVYRAHVAALNEPRAYLATVANRLVVNFHRRQALERAYLDVLATLPADCVPSPEAQVMVQEALVALDQMLDGLGPKVKQAFVLAQFEQMTYADIAARLGISKRSVNNYVARAMAHCCLYLAS